MDVLARLRRQPLIVVGGALAAVYAAVLAIVGSAMFARAPDAIGLAATLDLTLTATFVVWWFGIRRKLVRPWAAVATLSWGVALAKARVPHAPLGALLVMGGVLEVVTVGWLMVRIRRVVRAARAARDLGPVGAIEHGLLAARLPALAATILASELAVVGLALTGWLRRPAPGMLAMRSTGWLPVAGLIGFLLIGETAATHLLVAMASPLAAWIATASSAYLLLWLIADAQAIRLYPVAVVGATLHVRLGVRWRVAIPLADIASVTELRALPAGEPGIMNLALFEPSVLVTLRGPVEVTGLLGRRRWADRLALTIDDPRALIAAVT